MKKAKFLLPALLTSFLLVLGACGNSGISTGSDGNSVEKETESTESTETTEATQVDTGKTIDASGESADVLGMKVGLGEIKILEEKISVGINLENTASDALTFYPDQGKAVIGDMQLEANMFFTEGQVGGDVQSGIKQDGVIEFLAPEGKTIDVEAIKEVKLLFGDINTSDYMQSKPVEFTVPVQ